MSCFGLFYEILIFCTGRLRYTSEGSIRKKRISMKLNIFAASPYYPQNVIQSIQSVPHSYACVYVIAVKDFNMTFAHPHAGVSLPSTGLRHLPPLRLLPGGLLLAVMWPRIRPVPVQAWGYRPPVQCVRQPVCWGHKFRLWGWVGFSLMHFLVLLFRRCLKEKVGFLAVMFTAAVWYWC